ncbi:MAG: hypothetical protein J6X50_02585 [Bacilli bacterium]|nr:hypothetical protein [Bacilli bacterium]
MFIYVGLTILTALFGIIYENYSHNVFNADMSFAWAWLLGFGVGVYTLLTFLPIEIVPGTIPSSIYNFGVGMITVRSIFIGIIEIYGNAGVAKEELLMAYLVIFHVFLISGLLMYLAIIIYGLIKKKGTE